MRQFGDYMRDENDFSGPGTSKSSGIARAAMWLGGSALFGSLALVLWNRRALKSLHDAPDTPDEPPLSSDDDIY
jgi:hypothetical protein